MSPHPYPSPTSVRGDALTPHKWKSRFSVKTPAEKKPQINYD